MTQASRSIPTIALSVAEAAQSVGVSPDVIYAKIRTGEVHAVRLGKEPGKGDWRIGVREIERVFARPEESA